MLWEKYCVECRGGVPLPKHSTTDKKSHLLKILACSTPHSSVLSLPPSSLPGTIGLFPPLPPPYTESTAAVTIVSTVWPESYSPYLPCPGTWSQTLDLTSALTNSALSPSLSHCKVIISLLVVFLLDLVEHSSFHFPWSYSSPKQVGVSKRCSVKLSKFWNISVNKVHCTGFSV